MNYDQKNNNNKNSLKFAVWTLGKSMKSKQSFSATTKIIQMSEQNDSKRCF